jgi:hypothetical protein
MIPVFKKCAISPFSGGGRKVENPALEDALMAWVDRLRSQHLRVSRKMLQVQALELHQSGDFDLMEEDDDGWLQKFFRRHDVTLRYVMHLHMVLKNNLYLH